MVYQLRTKRGYDFYAVTSAMQKAIRRNQPEIAGYFALELFHSNFSNYLWKRLLTISAEDCAGCITKEIYSLLASFNLINEKEKEMNKGRIFISKAILILCVSAKCRDADHLQNFVYDKKIGISDKEIEKLLNDVDKSFYDIPDYAYDCHTKQGKQKGKTKEQFWKEELEALQPRQKGLFDDLIKNEK